MLRTILRFFNRGLLKLFGKYDFFSLNILSFLYRETKRRKNNSFAFSIMVELEASSLDLRDEASYCMNQDILLYLWDFFDVRQILQPLHKVV